MATTYAKMNIIKIDIIDINQFLQFLNGLVLTRWYIYDS